MKLRHVFGLLLLAGLGLPSVSLADGLVRDGVGPISTGRGGTNQGYADNAAIILDNPSAMVNVAGNGLAEAGVDVVTPVVDYTNPFNDVNSKVRPLPMPVLGYVRKSEDGCWAWGVGAFVPAGFGASYGVMTNPVVGPHLYRSIGGLAKILPALSYKVTDRLAIGGTLGIGFGHVQFDGPFFIQSPPLTGLPAVLDYQATGVAPTGSVGMQYQLTDRTVVGATYTTPTNLTCRGPVQAVLFPGFPIASSFDTKFHITWPQSVAVGLKHEICPHRRVSADVIWYDWRRAFDEFNFQFSNPSNPIIAGLLGGGSIHDNFPVHWRDSVSMRLGYEWDATARDTLRTGYVYHNSPVPNSTLNPYLDGILNHAFSLGYSRKMDRVVLNAAYQYSFGHTHHVGTSSIVGGDFDNSTLRAQAHFAMLSVLVPF
jgi:long-chain fatty acid transport protein